MVIVRAQSLYTRLARRYFDNVFCLVVSKLNIAALRYEFNRSVAKALR